MSKMTLGFALLTSMTLVPSSNSQAQEVGDRLRVTLGPPDVILVGQVIELHAGRAAGFTLDTGQGLNFRIDATNIQLLQRSTGTGTYLLNGLLIGAGVGVIVPFVVGLAATGGLILLDLPDFMGDVLPITTVVGGVVGLGIGALKKRDHWETIHPMDGSVGMTSDLILNLRSRNDGSIPTMDIGVVLRF